MGDRAKSMRLQDERFIADFEGQLESFSENGASPVDWIITAIREKLEMSVSAAMRLEPGEDGWVPGLFHVQGRTHHQFDRYFSLIATVGGIRYDPRCPQPSQRNEVVTLDDLCVMDGAELDDTRDLLATIGVEDQDQLRVLVCDGPMLLAWIGGFKPSPFTARDRRLLARLTPAMRKALAMHRRLLDAQLAHAGLAAALEQIGGPCFLVAPGGVVAHANGAGRALLDKDAAVTRDRVRGMIRRGEEGVSRVISEGQAPHHLVLLRDDSWMLAMRVERARTAWTLTPQQTRVLELLVQGDSNKSIGVKLARSEAAVEIHVTALFRKSTTRSRGELSARFWNL